MVLVWLLTWGTWATWTIVPPGASPHILAPLSLSSFHLSMDRRRAFMKKFPTVEGSRPSCRAMVTCISLLGRFVSCNIEEELAAPHHRHLQRRRRGVVCPFTYCTICMHRDTSSLQKHV
ncbi:hypothetical protein E2C01_074306 [Portunus trituberculatus]|uniref:Uncharacterized protein n=1 Tax=Portunus trituberculatus TaxID=210409 RepID=A0A5B7I317_PORTR|nr:hypothetical protein [Portunus trituberculatus]